MKQKIKAIIFDVGGVLAGKTYSGPEPPSDEIHIKISKNLGINLDTWIDAIDSIYGESIEGKISLEKARSIISKNLGIAPRKLEQIIVKTYKELFPLNKKICEYALRKKKEGFKIAILSDQWPFSKKAIINSQLSKKFDSVIISCDVRMRKPNPKIYKLSLRKLHIKPSEAIFIDNRDWNLRPAKKLGMKTILFKNNKQAIHDIENILK